MGSRSLELTSEQILRSRGKHSKIPPDRVCSNCGKKTTRMIGKYPLWRRHGVNIVCQKCYGELNKKGTKPLKCDICGRWKTLSHHTCYTSPRRQCWKCGNNTTRMKKGKHPVWRHHYDGQGEHIVCESCFKELHKKGRYRIRHRRCYLCKTDKSVEGTNRQNHWYRYDDGFVCGYVCKDCNRITKGVRPLQEYLESIKVSPDRKCSKCGGSETEVDKKGQAHWFKDGNEGFWCRNCYNKNKRKLRKQPRRLPINHIPADRKCSKCGSFKTQLNKKGHAYWFDNHKGNGGFWCRNCYRKERMKDPQVLEKTRAAGRRYAAEHRRKEKDIRQARSQMMRAREPT
jgi:hypothetical protein